MKYRRFCYQIYWRMQAKINPALNNSQVTYEHILNECLNEKCFMLDLGCGHNLLPSWRYEQECRLINRAKCVFGLDFDFESLKKHKTINKRIRGDIGQLPFPSDCFDLIASNMVFEHLKKPIEQMREIYRILKPGGMLIFHTPNSYSYSTIAAKIIPEFVKGKIVWLLHGRKEDDVFPAYYNINKSKEINKISKLVGFKIMQIKIVTSSAQLIMLPPLMIFELFLLRILMLECMEKYRPYFIVKLQKPNKSAVIK